MWETPTYELRRIIIVTYVHHHHCIASDQTRPTYITHLCRRKQKIVVERWVLNRAHNSLEVIILHYFGSEVQGTGCLCDLP